MEPGSHIHSSKVKHPSGWTGEVIGQTRLSSIPRSMLGATRMFLTLKKCAPRPHTSSQLLNPKGVLFLLEKEPQFPGSNPTCALGPSSHYCPSPYLQLGLDLTGFATSQHLDVTRDLQQEEKAPVSASQMACAPHSPPWLPDPQPSTVLSLHLWTE